MCRSGVDVSDHSRVREKTAQISLRCLFLLFLFLSLGGRVWSQVPTFVHATRDGGITIVGRDPAQGGKTEIPTLIVPVTLDFQSRTTGGKSASLTATGDVPQLV